MATEFYLYGPMVRYLVLAHSGHARTCTVLPHPDLESEIARGLKRSPAAVGRFDLYDAWAGDENPRRAQITFGHGLFNEVNPGGRSCNGCHNSANDGTNVNDALFDIGTASAAACTSGLPLYTFRKRDTGELRQLTDAGHGNVTGAWSDLGRFKTPTYAASRRGRPTFTTGSPPLSGT